MMDLEGQRFAELQGIGEKRVRAGFIQKAAAAGCWGRGEHIYHDVDVHSS